LTLEANPKCVPGAITKEICKQVNLGTNILEASSVLDNEKEERNKIDEGTIVEGLDGFAQVFPEHKYHMVELLQEKGYFRLDRRRR
jgi:H+-transporting ATPase